MFAELFFLFLFIAFLMQKPIFRFCAENLRLTTTSTTTRVTTSTAVMSSAAAVLTATSSSPKNILNNNNNNNTSSSSASKPVTTVNQIKPTTGNNVVVTAANTKKSINGHDLMKNGGDHNGLDVVDKAAAVADVREGGELVKLIEAGGDKTTTTTTMIDDSNKNKNKSKDTNGVNGGASCLLTVPGMTTTTTTADDDVVGDLSRSDSRTSCDSINNLPNDDSGTAAALEDVDEEEAVECAGDVVTTTSATGAAAAALVNSSSDTLKKKLRLSSGRQLTKKAKRVRFYRNGDKFYAGLVIPVSNERYRSFESLTEDLTRVLGESIKVPGAVRTIYTVDGKVKVGTLEELEDGKCYVCACNNEVFKRCEYSSQQQNNIKLNNRLSR